MKYKKRSATDLAARRQAKDAGEIHYQGDVCDDCKDTLKYSVSGKCVPCRIAHQAYKNHKKNPYAKPTRKRIHELNPLTDQEKFMARMLRQWRVWCGNADSGDSDGGRRHDQAKGSTGGAAGSRIVTSMGISA